MAGADSAQPALRHGHEGPGRLPDLLRAAGGLRPRRQHRARPRRRGAERGQWRPGQRRHLGDLEAQAGRAVARRQALHRRRRRLQLGIRGRPRHRRRHQRRLPRDRAHRQARQPHRQARVHQAPALLGRRVLRPQGHAHPQARFRALSGRQVARSAGQPQAGGHGRLPFRGLQAGRRRARGGEPGLSRREPAFLRRTRDEGRRRRRLRGTRRAPDRRVRLRVEHAGGGRHPPPARAGRQGAREHLAHRQPRAHPVQLH